MSADAETQKQLAFAVLEFLQTAAVRKESAEPLKVAAECIADAFGIDPEDPADQAAYSIKPGSLLSIFGVFLNTQKKVKTAQKPAQKDAAKSNAADDKKRAEEFKAQGNKFLAEKKYAESVDAYTKAIEIDSNNAVYYANRAAAYLQLQDYQSALSDSELAIAVDEKYSKAYSRLGFAHFSLGNYKDAIAAYEKGLAIDPQNKALISSLETARKKLDEAGGDGEYDDLPELDAVDAARATAAGANPLAGLAGLGGLGGLGGPGGPDLGALMSDPNIMNMAQQMMSNPQMMAMAQNMMGGGGRGGGGMDPNMLANLAGMLGGGGGAPGRGRGRGRGGR